MPFTEVAYDIWVARYPWFDVNVSLIRGAAGLLVVDTHASALAAQEVVRDIRLLGAGPVVAVANTHEHFDHTFGNGVFRAAYGAIPIYAHEVAAERTVPAGENIKAQYDEPENRDDPHRDEVQATEIVAADTPFSSAVALDLGDRLVELVHPAAATPPETWSCGSPTPTWCWPATWWRSRRRATRCPASARSATRWSGR